MAKTRAYFKNRLDVGSIIASATATGYDVNNLAIFLEDSLWKGVGIGTHTITHDVGPSIGNDYIGVANHNLVGATFKFQYSTDNFSSDINDAVSFTVPNNKPFLKEFTSQNKPYWRIQLTSLSAIPFMAIAYWGERVEWDYPALFDPDSQNNKANVNISKTGLLLAINERYIERILDLKFRGVEDGSALWIALKSWWNDHGLNLLFIAWDIDNHPGDIYFVYPDPDFKGPFITATLREISLKFKGRV